jgi:hypothetical protein
MSPYLMNQCKSCDGRMCTETCNEQCELCRGWFCYKCITDHYSEHLVYLAERMRKLPHAIKKAAKRWRPY